VSIDDSEARRPASFLGATDPRDRPGVGARLRQSADALIQILR
jgi:hypothetical protein